MFEHRDSDALRRRAILMVTGNSGVTTREESTIRNALWAADALLSGIVLSGPPRGSCPWTIGTLVNETGGDIICSSDLSKVFPEMIRRICSRYTLCYRFPEGRAGSIRNIDVQLSPQARKRYPDARVVARGGYRLRPRDRYGFAAR